MQYIQIYCIYIYLLYCPSCLLEGTRYTYTENQTEFILVKVTNYIFSFKVEEVEEYTYIYIHIYIYIY